MDLTVGDRGMAKTQRRFTSNVLFLSSGSTDDSYPHLLSWWGALHLRSSLQRSHLYLNSVGNLCLPWRPGDCFSDRAQRLPPESPGPGHRAALLLSNSLRTALLFKPSASLLCQGSLCNSSWLKVLIFSL